MASITVESELMKNQKLATVMPTQETFDVVQTKEGDTLVFSIRSERLVVTREEPASPAGYTEIEMNPDDANFEAKTFAVSQNPITLEIDIVLAVVAHGTDSLYAYWKHPNTRAAWNDTQAKQSDTQAKWVPLDDGLENRSVEIIFLQTTQQKVGPYPVRSLYVDMRVPRSGPLRRFYIDTSGPPRWEEKVFDDPVHTTIVSSCPALLSTNQGITPGLYTLLEGADTTKTLAFSLENGDNREFPAPPKITAINSALNYNDETNLFIATDDGLFLFPAEDQDTLDPILFIPIIPATSDNVLGTFASVGTLAASTNKDRTVVWGLHPQGDLVYSSCLAGEEKNPGKWSAPVTLASNVENFAFDLHRSQSNHVMFIETKDDRFLQLSQAPLTEKWTETSLLLPASGGDPVEIYTFTSHAEVFDTHGRPFPHATVKVESKVGVSMYINDVYHKLVPSEPIEVFADATGVITLIQETKSVSAFCYQLSVDGIPPVLVNPSSNALKRLSAISSPDELRDVRIQSGRSSKPLIASTVSPQDVSKVVDHFKFLLNVNKTLPPDGSPFASSSEHEQYETPSKENDQKLYPLRMPDGLTAEVPFSLLSSAEAFGEAFFHPLEDLYHAVKHGVAELEDFGLHLVGKVYHLILQVGGQIYKCILNCISAVEGAIELVFRKIGVLFEDLVAWLGFVFDWDDIVRTHNVMKNVFKSFCQYGLNKLQSSDGTIKTDFENIKERIHNLENVLTDAPENEATLNPKGLDGASSPQCHWALHHIKSGFPKGDSIPSDAPSSAADVDPPDGSEEALKDLEAAVGAQFDDLRDMTKNIKDAAKNIKSYGPEQLLGKVIEILVNQEFKSVETVVTCLIEFLKRLGETLLHILGQPIYIPVLSWVYKEKTGSPLSVLDLMCLVGAIPITATYKAATKNAPFPENEHTTALINAPDFESIKKLINQPTAYTSAMKWDTGNTLNFAFNICGGFGSLLTIYTSAMEHADGYQVPPGILKGLTIAANILCLSPNIPSFWSGRKDWATRASQALTIFSYVKCSSNLISRVPGVSEGLDSILGIFYLVTAVVGAVTYKLQKTSDWFSLVYNIIADIAQILAAPSSEFYNAETFEAFIVLTSGLMFVSGKFAFLTDAALFIGN